MEASSERETPDRRIGPTVSKDKWLNHARVKLTRGYVLIIGTTRRTANFYSREKGYEMCAYNVARQLVKDGAVIKTGQHQLGDVYELVMVPAVQPDQPRPVEDDEMTALLHQLERDGLDDGPSAPPAA